MVIMFLVRLWLFASIDPRNLMMAIVIVGAIVILEIVGSVAVAVALMRRLDGWRLAGLVSRSLTWSMIGPFVALASRVGLVILVLAPFWLTTYVLLSQHLPVVAAWLHPRGQQMPTHAQWLADGWNFAARFGGLLGEGPLVVAKFFVIGRIAGAAYGRSRPQTQVPEPEPEPGAGSAVCGE